MSLQELFCQLFGKDRHCSVITDTVLSLVFLGCLLVLSRDRMHISGDDEDDDAGDNGGNVSINHTLFGAHILERDERTIGGSRFTCVYCTVVRCTGHPLHLLSMSSFALSSIALSAHVIHCTCCQCQPLLLSSTERVAPVIHSNSRPLIASVMRNTCP